MKIILSRMSIGFILVTLCFAFSPVPTLAAAENQDTPDVVTIKQGDVNGIKFMSGGVGLEERAAMEKMAKDYNLKVVCAITAGNYLADAKITISAARGKALLEESPEGPWLYVKLPAGEYQVRAAVSGKQEVRKVTVGAGLKTVQFVWKNVE